MKAPVELKNSVAILGGASCVRDDFAALEAMVGAPWPGIVVAVNDIGCHWSGRLDAWVTLHPEKLHVDKDHPQAWGWLQQRAEAGHPNGFLTVAKRNPELVDRLVTPWAAGSSGLLAVVAAEGVYGCGPGGSRAVLCGVPLDDRPHFTGSLVHPAGKRWSSADSHWRGWKRNLDRMRGWVRSMSGRTRDHLGAPDAEWLGVA